MVVYDDVAVVLYGEVVCAVGRGQNEGVVSRETVDTVGAELESDREDQIFATWDLSHSDNVQTSSSDVLYVSASVYIVTCTRQTKFGSTLKSRRNFELRTGNGLSVDLDGLELSKESESARGAGRRGNSSGQHTIRIIYDGLKCPRDRLEATL